MITAKEVFKRYEEFSSMGEEMVEMFIEESSLELKGVLCHCFDKDEAKDMSIKKLLFMKYVAWKLSVHTLLQDGRGRVINSSRVGGVSVSYGGDGWENNVYYEDYKQCFKLYQRTNIGVIRYEDEVE